MGTVRDASDAIGHTPVAYNRSLAEAELFVHFPSKGELAGAGGLSEPPSPQLISETETRTLAQGLRWVSRRRR
jgi:hypothetical protein